MSNNTHALTNIVEENVLKAHYVPNNLKKEGQKGKYFFRKDHIKNVDHDTLLQRTFDAIPGVRKETLQLAVDTYQNMAAVALMNGESVSTRLFHATATLRGSSENGRWNDEENHIVVSFRQGKRIRELIANTRVDVLGPKTAVYCISDVVDHATGATDGTATINRCLTLVGTGLMVEGDLPEVGMSLTNEASGEYRNYGMDYIVHNKSTMVIIQMPADLEEGQYTLTLTSQGKSKGDKFTRATHQVSISLYLSPIKA